MRLHVNCSACVMKQAISIMESYDVPADQQITIINELLAKMNSLTSEQTPSHCHSEMLITLAHRLGTEDLYYKEKSIQNVQALALVPLVSGIIAKNPDKLYAVLKVAAAGNIIDLTFGKEYDIEDSLGKCMAEGFARDDYNKFVARLMTAKSLLFVTDNAGEIVFDRLLIEQIQHWRSEHSLSPLSMTLMVKGGPALNDALREDAEFVGLPSVSKVADSGCSYLGLPLEHISPEALDLVRKSDLILAKGQANFETLEEEGELHGRLFLLLKAKCSNVAGIIGTPVGSAVFYMP